MKEQPNIETILSRFYGVSLLEAPVEAIVWAADRLADECGIEYARAELKRANRLRAEGGVVEHCEQLEGKAMSQYETIPESEQSTILSCFWAMLNRMHQQAWDSENTLDRRDVEAYYRLWNRVTGDSHKAAWEE